MHGTSDRSPTHRRPTFTGWKPSTSLSGSIAVQDLLGVDVLGQRQLDQDAVDLGIAVEPVDQRQELGLATSSAASLCSYEFMPTSTVCAALFFT